MTAQERITEWAALADTCAVCGDARRHHVFGSVCPGWRPSAPGALADAAVPAMAAALTAVLGLHRAITIYDECDCTDEQKETGHEDIHEVGLTCNKLYVICDECCRNDAYQTEDCADHHDHKPDEAICPTVAAIETALAVTP